MLVTVGVCLALVSSAEPDARVYVDQIRREHGLAAVRPNQALQRAAESHVRYMVVNETAGHSQTPDSRGYTGRTPGDRARHFGYVGANSEAVGWGDLGAQEMMRGLFEAPYHRVLFLQPSAPDFGSAFAEGAMCLKFGGVPGSGAVVSPPNGARGVRGFWDGVESPDPLRNTNLRGPVGYPIVLAVFGREAEGFRAIDARIVGPNGRVAAIVRTPATDQYSQDTVIVIPSKPLLPATTYTVTFNYANASGEKTARTTFVTAR